MSLRRKLFRGGSGVAWSPHMFGADVEAWWSARATPLITKDAGNLVSSFKDIRFGYDFTQGTGSSQLLYVAKTALEPALLAADGLDDSMTLAPVPSGISIGASPCEEWLLCRQDSTDPAVTATMASTGGSTSGSIRRIYKAGINGVNRYLSDLSATGSTASKANTGVVAAGWHIIRSIYGADFVRTDVDGVPGPTFAATPAVANTRARLFSTGAAGASSLGQGAITDRLHVKPRTDYQAALLTDYFQRVLALQV